MRNLLMASVCGLVFTLSAAGAATAAQLFDFDGQAVNPVVVGGTLDMDAVLVNNTALTLPLPLDLDNFEYTVVVTGLTWDSTGPSDYFSGGQIAIFKDSVTPADYTNPSSFTDGTAILTGALTTLQRTMFTSTLGSAVGTVDWTGGSRIGEIAPADRLSWPFLVNVSRAASQVQSGYDERWDGKVEPRDAVVSTEGATWSSLKGRF